MSSRKTTYFPLPQRIISKYDFCRRHHAVEIYFPHCGKIRAAAPGFFHTMEKLCAIFPHNGTTLGPLFHTVEKWGGFFPHRGKMGRIFSTLWKKVFHTVEKVAGGPGAPWKKGPHISRRPFPAGPQKRPLRTMMAPRTVTTSGAPCTAKPS